jgi:hypothetical protein
MFITVMIITKEMRGKTLPRTDLSLFEKSNLPDRSIILSIQSTRAINKSQSKQNDVAGCIADDKILFIFSRSFG